MPMFTQQPAQPTAEELQLQNAALLEKIQLGERKAKLRPDRPEFTSLLEDGKLPEDMVVQNLYDPAAIQAIQERALSTEQSPWASMQLEKQGLEETMARDQARSLTSSGEAQARSRLAMKGGLGGGAAERIASGGARNLLQGLQGVGQQGALARSNIGLQDEQMRMNLLQNLPGMQAQQAGLSAGIQGQNIGNRMDLTGDLNKFNLGMYGEDMQAWAAKEQAKATKSAGCFSPDTYVEMKDGSRKQIGGIKIGDATKGGKVTGVQHFAVKKGQLIYNYRGIIVSGSQAVFENNVWMRVQNSDKAELYAREIPIVCDFSCEDHRIYVDGRVFADFEETDDYSISDVESLRRLNEPVK